MTKNGQYKISDIKDLIRRARELAALREKASPGWEDPIRRGSVIGVRMMYAPGETFFGAHFSLEEDARFAVAAWEMADLLDAMADALEKAYNVVWFCPECFSISDKPAGRYKFSPNKLVCACGATVVPMPHNWRDMEKHTYEKLADE